MIATFRTGPCFLACVCGAVTWLGNGFSLAQELEARRWGHLPIGSSVLGGGYAYTQGEIAFDPVMRIEEGEVEMHSAAMKYLHSFELLGKSARFELVQGYAQAEWRGTLDGAAASTARTGWTDTTLRVAMQLFGAPPLEGKEFAAYRASVADCETVVGVGLAVQLPTGHYLDDRLLNLGSNRFTVRPQVGVVHTRGKWSVEGMGSVWLFSENDEFFGGNSLEQDPMFTIQGHLVYTFRPGLWLSCGAGYESGGVSSLNGTSQDNEQGNLGWQIGLGIPINRQMGLKISYIGMRTQEDTGLDSDSFAVGASYMW